jgi:hypothetical protein
VGKRDGSPHGCTYQAGSCTSRSLRKVLSCFKRHLDSVGYIVQYAILGLYVGPCRFFSCFCLRLSVVSILFSVLSSSLILTFSLPLLLFLHLLSISPPVCSAFPFNVPPKEAIHTPFRTNIRLLRFRSESHYGQRPPSG